MKKKVLIILAIVVVFITGIVAGILIYLNSLAKNKPEAVLSEYIQLINEQKYEEMYDLISEESKEKNFTR